MDEKTISDNIKKFRKQLGITLQDLADRTGLTKGYLSKVERSSKAPPYSTLNKITDAMGIEITELFRRDVVPLPDRRIAVGKKKDGRVIRQTSDVGGYDYEVMAPSKPGKNMEPFIIYAPFEMEKMYEHEGEEFVYVMEGKLEFVYGDETYMLEQGDHVYFDCCIPHSGRSIGEKKAKLMVVIYHYKRTGR